MPSFDVVSEYTYEDGSQLICPECAHEWSANGEAEARALAEAIENERRQFGVYKTLWERACSRCLFNCQHIPQSPLNTPGRFSINDRTPSLASSLLSNFLTSGCKANAAAVSPSRWARRADCKVA